MLFVIKVVRLIKELILIMLDFMMINHNIREFMLKVDRQMLMEKQIYRIQQIDLKLTLEEFKHMVKLIMFNKKTIQMLKLKNLNLIIITNNYLKYKVNLCKPQKKDYPHKKSKQKNHLNHQNQFIYHIVKDQVKSMVRHLQNLLKTLD